MATPPQHPETKVRRYRWNRPFVLALILLMTVPWLAYAWVAVCAAKDMRKRLVLECNLAMVQLCARILDVQCDCSS